MPHFPELGATPLNDHTANNTVQNTARSFLRVPQAAHLNGPNYAAPFNQRRKLSRPSALPSHYRSSMSPLGEPRHLASNSSSNDGCIPLPISRPERGRTDMLSRFYSSPSAKYTGKASDYHSLTKHKRLYYKQCHIARLSAAEGLECLCYMIDVHSLAGKFYLDFVDQQVGSLEEAFQNCIIGPARTLTHTCTFKNGEPWI